MTEFLTFKTSNPGKRGTTYFETLEELLEWVKKKGEVIVSATSRGAWVLEEYDDYRE